MVELIVSGVLLMFFGGLVYKQFDCRLKRLEDKMDSLLLKNGIVYYNNKDKPKDGGCKS